MMCKLVISLFTLLGKRVYYPLFSPKDALCQVWLKLSQYVFLLFCNYLLLEKGVALHLNKLPFAQAKDILRQVCLKLAQWFLI